MAIDYNILFENGRIRIHGGLLEDNQGIVTGPSGLPVDTDTDRNYKNFRISSQGLAYTEYPGVHVSHFLENEKELGDDPDPDVGLGGDIVDGYEDHYKDIVGLEGQWSDDAYLNEYITSFDNALPDENELTINTTVNESQIETGVMIRVKTESPVVKTEYKPNTKHEGVVIKKESK